MSSGIEVPAGDFTSVPGAPQEPQRQGFWATVGDSMSLNWHMQAADRISEWLYPSVPGYDPMQEERLKGREHWAPYLWDARSPEEFHARMNRFMDNEDRRARGSVNDTLWTGLAAGLGDPLNLVPVPAGMIGRGVAKGALIGAGVNAGLTAASYGARRALDPTQPESLKEELLYGAALGGILGGVGGFAGAGFHPEMGRLAKAFATRQAELDLALNPPEGAFAEAVPRMTRYEARASDGFEGIKPTGLGLEKAVGMPAWWNPLGTAWGQLVQSGHRSLQDFAQLMGGDGGLTLKDHEQGRVTTGASAYLASGRWKAYAADTLGELHRAYAEYLGKPKPAEVVGLNLGTVGPRLGAVARKMMRRQRTDGRMEFNEWLEAIFLAHRKDGLAANVEKMREHGFDTSPEAVQSVLKGAGVVRQFFDRADREGTGAGFLKQPYAKVLAERFAVYDKRLAESERLHTIAERTNAEQAQLRWLDEIAIPRLRDSIPEKAHLERQYLRLREQWAEAIAEYKLAVGDERRAIRTTVLDPLHLKLRELELQGIGLRKTPPPVRGKDIQPDTWDPGDHTAANEPPPATTVVNGQTVGPVTTSDRIAAGAEASEGIAAAFRSYGKDAPEAGKAANDADWTPTFVLEEVDAPPGFGRPPEPVGFHPDDMPSAMTPDQLQELEAYGSLEGGDQQPLDGELVPRQVLVDYDQDGRPIYEDEYDLFRSFTVSREGAPVAEVTVTYNPGKKEIHVEWVGRVNRRDGLADLPTTEASPDANSFGPRFTLDVGRQLRKHFPEAEKISGYRISGARARHHAMDEAQVKIPDLPRARIQGWEPGQAEHPAHLAAANDAHPTAPTEHPILSGPAANDFLELPARIEERLPDGGFAGWELHPANEDQPLGGHETDPLYLTRRWDHQAVRANPDGLRAAIDRWKAESGQERMTDEEWGRTLERILQGQEGGQERFTGTPVGGLFRKGRKLDVPNEYVSDFVERNVASLMLEYSHRFGAGLEVHNRFGSRDALDAIDEGVLRALGEREGTVESLLAWAHDTSDKMKYLRDQTLGDLHVQDPLTLSKVAAEGVKAWASTAMLGKVVFSQMVEVARPLMTHGFQRNFGFITDNLIGNLAAFKEAGRDLRGIVGECIDVAHGQTGARLMEFGDLTRPGSTLAHSTRAALDPFLSFAHGPWYIMNLMGPVTDITKNYVMVAASHFLIEDMRRLVAGRAGQKTAERLAALNIDVPLARQILEQPIEKSGRIHLANLSGWHDQALANEFAAAIRADVNRVINTPGPQTKSAISQGFLQYGDGRRQWALVTLPFQFLSWGLSAAQKISMSALQGRDANAMAGVATLIGTAYAVQWLKTDPAMWDRTPMEERLYRAVDQSGALALAGNVNSMIEAASLGTLGVRPAFGMPPGYGAVDGYDAAGVAGGPAGHIASDLAKAFIDPSLTQWQRATLLRKGLPLNSAFGIDALFKGVQAGLYDPAY